MKNVETILKDLGIKKVEKWHNYSMFSKMLIHYFGFKHKGIDYCVSNTTCSYVFSKLVKGNETTIYMGYSLENLESALRQELCMQN